MKSSGMSASSTLPARRTHPNMIPVYYGGVTTPCARPLPGRRANDPPANMVSAALCAADMPLQLAIVVALPMVPVQARLLMVSYGKMLSPGKSEGWHAPAPANILSPPQCAGEVEPP